MSLLVDKYRPKKIEDIQGNKLQIKRCLKWIENFNNKVENTKPALLISGPPGIGKTTLVSLLLDKYKYDIIEYNASDVRNQKLVKENLKSIMGKISISSIMGGNTKLGIIMDEVDGMSSGDKGGISELISFINPNKGKRKKNKDSIKYTNPIICISNNDTDKKMRDLMKECESIKFKLPNLNELYTYAKKIINLENITISDEEILSIVNFCQKDIRKLVCLLEDVKIGNKKNINVNSLLNSLDKKHQDSHVLTSTYNIMNEYKGINDTTRIFNTDKNMIGLIIHQNIFDFMKNYKNDEKNQIHILSKIFEYFSYSDFFDKEIFINCSYELQELNAIYKCCVPSFLLNKQKKYSVPKFTVNDMVFTKILSKFSLQYYNYKNIILFNRKLKIYSNKNHFNLYLSIIKYLILEFNNQKIKKKKLNQKIIYLIHKYEINIDILEKMNKFIILNFKNTKQENLLNNIVNKDIDKKLIEKILKFII